MTDYAVRSHHFSHQKQNEDRQAYEQQEQRKDCDNPTGPGQMHRSAQRQVNKCQTCATKSQEERALTDQRAYRVTDMKVMVTIAGKSDFVRKRHKIHVTGGDQKQGQPDDQKNRRGTRNADRRW
ncbi:hypothetical protein SLH49_01435 [Cognatiyoonia sp. IB215446]|uniref:hypothetical protein n=1 Tax=Cognatiyoonia sp. IB215446 TaxID=3097355 RepID=UPI002A12B409|nr:hypothetical protein [Cognatiyoonia sp. IB215446]MDX8346634.1 hypothetical protein [Cognatiyoonia sp. IB215446]